MLVVFVVSILQLTCLFGTDWFAIEAFGVHHGFFETLCLGTLVQLVATVVPTPGGTGGIEAAFLYFFSRYLKDGAVACFLVWRIVTFYAYTGLCGILTFIHSSGGKSKPYDGLRRFIGKNAIDFAGAATPDAKAPADDGPGSDAKPDARREPNALMEPGAQAPPEPQMEPDAQAQPDA